MINPAKLFKIKSAWETFTTNHPKFPKFISAVQKSGIQEGTVIEINITTPSGETISSNLRLTQSDMELFREVSEMGK